MSMTDDEIRALRSYSAFILKAYGFQMPPDDPVLPALYIIHREMQLNNKVNKAVGEQIAQAASNLRGKSYHFNVPGESFKYQIAAAVKYLAIGLITLAFCAVGVWFWALKNEINTARDVIQTSGKARMLLERMKKDREGFYFIEFKSSKGNSIANFHEFEWIDKETVRVYLGKMSNEN